MSIGCTPGIHNASPLVDALASRLWPCALRLRPHAARARRMRAATVARTSRTPRPTSSRTGQRTRRCILGRQAYVQPAARPHATLRARAPIPVDLVDRRPRANGRATTAAHSAGGKRADESRNVRGILQRCSCWKSTNRSPRGAGHVGGGVGLDGHRSGWNSHLPDRRAHARDLASVAEDTRVRRGRPMPARLTRRRARGLAPSAASGGSALGQHRRDGGRATFFRRRQWHGRGAGRARDRLRTQGERLRGGGSQRRFPAGARFTSMSILRN